MTLVDSSTWIDYFNGVTNRQTDALDRLLSTAPLVTGDLILAEVLQGFDDQRSFDTARELLTALEVVTLAGPEIAIRAAMNFRALRSRGVTVRKTVDTIIATYCMEHGLELLHNERDFDPFVRYLGLRVPSFN